jgi:hypothetical protein
MRKLNTKWMHPCDQIILIIDKIYRSGMTTTSGGKISIIDEDGDVWVTPSAGDNLLGTFDKLEVAEFSAKSLTMGASPGKLEEQVLQQVVLQVINARFEFEFSDSSFGFRPNKNLHQAVLKAQGYINEGLRSFAGTLYSN